MKISRQKRLGIIKRTKVAVERIRTDGWEKKLVLSTYFDDWAIRIVDMALKKLNIKVKKSRR